MKNTSKTCFIDCFKQSLLFSFLAFSLFLGSSEAAARTSPFCVSIAESPFISSVDAPYAVQGRDSVSENQDKNHGKLETLPVWKEGGSAGMYEFVKKNLHYPEESAKKRIQGKVIVRFIIDKDGSITNAKVTRSVDSLLDKEALRVVGIMPRWTPGSFNGNPAKAYFILPITFTLDSLHVKSFIKPLVASGNCPLIVVNGEIKDYPIDSQKKLVENGFIEKEAVANWFKVRVRDVKKIEIVQPKKAIELFGVKGTKDGVVKYTIKNMPYEKVDKPATWKEGGNTALFSFLSANLKYPVVCQENGVQGIVLVVFIVEKDGSIGYASVIRSSGATFLDQEALRVVNLMPNWNPALIKDKPVRSFFVVPITFRLKK